MHCTERLRNSQCKVGVESCCDHHEDASSIDAAVMSHVMVVAVRRHFQ